jgi:hypothetical protein
MIDVFVFNGEVESQVGAEEQALAHYESQLCLVCMGEGDESIAQIDFLRLTLHSLQKVVLLL